MAIWPGKDKAGFQAKAEKKQPHSKTWRKNK